MGGGGGQLVRRGAARRRPGAGLIAGLLRELFGIGMPGWSSTKLCSRVLVGSGEWARWHWLGRRGAAAAWHQHGNAPLPTRRVGAARLVRSAAAPPGPHRPAVAR